MVKLLAGVPGSGKTKVMIKKANEAAAKAKGEVVFVDIVDKHSAMLDRNIRLVYTDEFKINSLSSLYGLLCGMISANRDIEEIYVDGVDKIALSPLDNVFVDFLELTEKFSNDNDLLVVLSSNIEGEDLEKAVERFK